MISFVTLLLMSTCVIALTCINKAIDVNWIDVGETRIVQPIDLLGRTYFSRRSRQSDNIKLTIYFQSLWFSSLLFKTRTRQLSQSRCNVSLLYNSEFHNVSRTTQKRIRVWPPRGVWHWKLLMWTYTRTGYARVVINWCKRTLATRCNWTHCAIITATHCRLAIVCPFLIEAFHKLVWVSSRSRTKIKKDF